MNQHNQSLTSLHQQLAHQQIQQQQQQQAQQHQQSHTYSNAQQMHQMHHSNYSMESEEGDVEDNRGHSLSSSKSNLSDHSLVRTFSLIKARFPD